MDWRLGWHVSRTQRCRLEHQAVTRCIQGRVWKRRFYRVSSSILCLRYNKFNKFLSSKIWDTYSGKVLHSFSHNHIVRSVALSPDSTHLLTGGQEKKARIFDLTRPDAEPDFLNDGGGLSHDGMVRSVVWVGDYIVVTAGEDGIIK